MPIGLPPAIQHAARTRDDGKPALSATDLVIIAPPTAGELAYACGRGWMDVVSTVDVIQAKRKAGIPLHESEELLAAGRSSLQQFQRGAAALRTPELSSRSYWTYVLMAWGWSVHGGIPNTSTFVEAVYTSLDKPFQLEKFAWMGRRWGPKVGFLRSRRSAQLRAWAAYLAEEEQYYRDRGFFQRAMGR